MENKVLVEGGLSIAYQKRGEGPPLVLIAGVGYGQYFFHALAEKLVERFTVITFDNRGAGESDKPEGPYTVSMMAADTAALLDALSIRGAFVLGHSLGGFIAQELVHTRPELIGRLVLAGTNHGGPEAIPIPPEALSVLLRRDADPITLVRRGIDVACAPGFSERKPEIVKELLRYRLTNPVPPHAYSAQVMAGAAMATLSADEVRRRMAQISVPTLILFGEHDRVVPPENAPLLAEKIPDARVHILPGVGHMFPIEDPEATVSALVEFLEA